MKVSPDEPTEVFPVLPELTTTCEPVWVATESGADAETLYRAFRHGSRARTHLPDWAFEEVEDELRAGWLLNGEVARWSAVREAIRTGFETG
jgi:hypothetical protein